MVRPGRGEWQPKSAHINSWSCILNGAGISRQRRLTLMMDAIPAGLQPNFAGSGFAMAVRVPAAISAEQAPRRIIEGGLRLTEMADPNDEELMAAAAKGDEKAFRRLAERQLPGLLRLARSLTANSVDAEDIVQETLLRLWTAAPTWQPRAQVRTWLYRVALNLTIDRQRRLRPLADISEAENRDDGAAAAPDRIATDETTRAVQAAIAVLPERQRAALILTHYEGLSSDQAAAVLGTSLGGLESLLVRARRTLRERLAVVLKDWKEA